MASLLKDQSLQSSPVMLQVLYTSPFQESLILSYDGTGNDGYKFLNMSQNLVLNIYIKITLNLVNVTIILIHTRNKPDVSGSTAEKLMGLTSYGNVIDEWMPYAKNYVKNYVIPQNASDDLNDYGK